MQVLIDLYMLVLNWYPASYKCNAKKSRIFNQTGVSSQIQHSQSLCFAYLYSDCIFIHFAFFPASLKTDPLHHLCTTASLRVNKCHAECSQPIGVVVHNRWSECSHGLPHLCTRPFALKKRRNPMFAWIYREYSLVEGAKFTEWGNLQMQDLLLWIVTFVDNRAK